MHVPDGFLDARTLISTAGLAAIGLGLALREVRRHLPARRVPLIGLAAAFIFAAQMLNFPVAAGTSGHLLGAALASVLLGPAAAIVALTPVLLLQALMLCADIPGSGSPASPVHAVWKSETGETLMAGKQSLLHEAFFLLRGEEVPKHDRQGCSERTETGLACGEGIGKGIYAGAASA